jgi:hypothetical protein
MGGRNTQSAADWISGNYIEMSWKLLEVLIIFNSENTILRRVIFVFLWDKVMDVASRPV